MTVVWESVFFVFGGASGEQFDVLNDDNAELSVMLVLGDFKYHVFVC